MPKNKPCKGLLKRIRITKSGKVKFRRAFGRHLRSGKTRQLKRAYRIPAYAKSCDMGRVRALLHRSVRPSDSKAATTAATTTDE